ncbi:MAG: hypothetical protein CBB97_07105 [Candidatus Endolissoclinum sp. TMED37]|nr:MAG: hypothetical protein CBB97_07105 [Candidatus Endolissoclinum sp. TMED37]|tara:strand:+ start:740 stop:1108 length:369 start_codon:yes stop_codon:yes gene_type:complete
MSNEKRMWVPEIVYEEYEGSGLTDGLPFITIPKDKEMPGVLFFLGTQETGEFEPDENGDPQPIVEVEVYQFACMKYLEEALSGEDYDKVRLSMGLEPKLSARKKGLKTSASMVNNIAEKSKK